MPVADDALTDVFRRQAEQFEHLGAPGYARLAGVLAVDPEPARAVLGDDESWDGALRLFGAVHYLVLAGIAPAALEGPDPFLGTLREHLPWLRERVRTQNVQTNETLRCAGLLPAFLLLARETSLPVELLELGPSAGLNLLVDRYRYRYAEGSWGPVDALLELVPEERGGRVPGALLRQPLPIRRRRGIDLAPVDALTDDGALLLRSFLWPGRPERFERLLSAIETLRRAPGRPELLRGDYVELLPAVLAARPEDALTIVFQTASTGYLSEEAARRLRASLDAAGHDGRPLGWVSTRRRDEREGPHEDRYELELRLWPGPARLVGHIDFHGNWLDWQGL